MKKENREMRMMDATAHFVVRHKKLIPLIALILVVLSIFAAGRIRIKTEFKDLLPNDNPKIESYQEVNDRFNGGEKIIVVIEGESREQMQQAADAFASRVRSDQKLMDYVRALNVKADRQFIEEWGLLLQEAEDLERSEELYNSPNLLDFMRSLNNSMESEYLDSDPDEKLSNSAQERETVELFKSIEQFTRRLHETLNKSTGGGVIHKENAGGELARDFFLGEQYGFSWDNSMLLFTISPNVTVVDIKEGSRMMEMVKEHGRAVQAQFPETSIGYTGGVAMNADEMDYMGFDMVVPAIVALVLILLLFIASFREIRMIILVGITLLVGIIVNYGLIGITVQVITTITSFMATLLIGLGIDYGIQIIGNYGSFRSEGLAPEEALRQTYRRAGMGTFLAALTTATGFFVMAFTGSKAFAQFGLTAGLGIIACFTAMFFLLPSLLLLFGGKGEYTQKKGKAKRRGRHVLKYAFIPSTAGFLGKRRGLVISVALLLTIAFGYSAIRLTSFETDLMNLEPQDMPSIITYRKIIETYDLNPFTSFIVADSPAEARELTDQLEKESVVAQVESVGQLLPSPQDQRARLETIRDIRANRRTYEPRIYTASDIEEFAYEIQRFEWNVIEIGQLSIAGLGEDNQIVKKRNRMVHEVLGAEVGEPGREIFQKLISDLTADPAESAEKLTRLDRSFGPEYSRIVGTMLQADRPITTSDLPRSMYREYFDMTGEKNLVTIYPIPSVMDHIEHIRHFNREMGEISPKITGTTQFLVEWINEVFQSSRNAALLIFGVVFLMMMLTFRSLRYAATASIPLVAGLLWMLGIYPLIGLKMNPLNIAVIPLVIGMGIDFGIHIVHRFQIENNIYDAYHYTGKAVMLSGLTTIIGFGSLALIGTFKSIASIGEVLGLGIAAALCAALFFLPGFLGHGRNGTRTGGPLEARTGSNAALHENQKVTSDSHTYAQEEQNDN